MPALAVTCAFTLGTLVVLMALFGVFSLVGDAASQSFLPRLVPVGLSMGAENANELGYRQVVTPDRLQSRMNTTMRSINRAMIVLGALVGGLLADAIGYRTMLGAATGGFLLVAAGTTSCGRISALRQH